MVQESSVQITNAVDAHLIPNVEPEITATSQEFALLVAQPTLDAFLASTATTIFVFNALLTATVQVANSVLPTLALDVLATLNVELANSVLAMEPAEMDALPILIAFQVTA